MTDTMETARAPAAGYDTTQKAHYRNAVWDAMADAAKRNLERVDQSVCVVMPSREGLEIQTLVERGIPAERIVCVDQSAAVIATSLWRKRWPECRFFASKISLVGRKLRDAGMTVAAANLDLCGNFSDETLSEIDGFVSTAPLMDSVALAVTVMKGREGSVVTRMLDRSGVSFMQEKRLNGLFLETQIGESAWRILAEGAYKGKGFPVAWMALEHVPGVPESLWMPHVERAADLDRQAINIWLRQSHHTMSDFRKFQDLRAQRTKSEWAAEEAARKFIDGLAVVSREAMYNEALSRMIQAHFARSGFNKIAENLAPRSVRGWRLHV